jgi:hypothetical protein
LEKGRVMRKFNLDGTIPRERSKPCPHCGAMTHCDVCWEHVETWSPFGVWHCLLCRMPQAIYCAEGAGCDPVRCDFCGWDEATETTKGDNGQA